MPFLIENLKSHYCKFVFILAWVLSIYTMPEFADRNIQLLISIPFSTTFAFSMACIARSIKEKAVSVKRVGGSSLGIVTSVLGLSAIHICGIGNPMCGASVGLSAASALFPSVLNHYLPQISIIILLLGIALQIGALHKMKCFRTVISKNVTHSK